MSTNAAFAGPVPDAGAERADGSTDEPSSQVSELERWYVEQRAWPVRRDRAGRLWLEAGTEFDVVEVPEEAGRRALRRLIGYGQAALAPGPVALFEAPPSGRAAEGSSDQPPAAVPPKEPVSPDVTAADTARCWFFVAPGARDDLPELLDWLDWGGIELGMQAYGAGDRIPAPARNRWLHDPLAVPPEVIALLATIAQSCSRYALTRRVV